MKLSANNYAIEPNDTWYFDRLDSEQREDEAIEEFTKNFINNIAQPWHFLNRISETHCYDFFDELYKAFMKVSKKAKPLITLYCCYGLIHVVTNIVNKLAP